MTQELLETPTRTVGLTVNAPAVFEREDFRNWLNAEGTKVFTWHDKGEAPHEFSDVVVLVDSSYEGTNSDMPEDIWKAICDLAYSEYGGPEAPGRLGSHIAVRLTNLRG